MSEPRKVRNFDSVSLTGIGRLIIIQTDKESLTIQAEDNLLPYIETQVKGRTLTIGIRDFVSITPREKITYFLSVKDLSVLQISGLGDIHLSGLHTDKLSVEFSGGGNAVIEDLLTKNISIKLSGAGDFSLSGQVDAQALEISGAGNYDAGDLLSKTATVEISGAGNAIIWVTDMLTIELSGMGNLQYYGNPSIKQEISGLGKVESLGEK